jgi:hypothetical protein
MAKMKKIKIEGPSNYTAGAIYKLPMTPKQSIKFGKLAQSPKTADTLFTLPKGTTGLSNTEKKQMQDRRIADRKRTLARAEFIIRRDLNATTSGVNPSKPKAKPKSKPSKPKTTFG